MMNKGMNTNLLDDMRDSNLIRVREVEGETGIYACNFTRDAFIGHEWNDLTTKARGLFLDSSGKVVMRGFEKFFNIGENKETTIDAVLGKMTYPARVESKENGFLGLIGARPEEDCFRFYSKSGNTDYSDIIKQRFYDEMDDSGNIHQLWKIMTDRDITVAVEVIDMESDRHIITYSESRLYFIHAIRNTVDFAIDWEADDELDGLFQHRPDMAIVRNEDELVRELDNAKHSFREGCVVYGRDGYMVKVKSDLYLKAKSLRTPLRRVLVNGKPVPQDDSPRSIAVRWVLDNADASRLTYMRKSDGMMEPDMTYVSRLLIANPDALGVIALPFAGE